MLTRQLRTYQSSSQRFVRSLSLVALITVGLAACDQVAVQELKPGVSTEQDVRTKLGKPEITWEREDGKRVLEFPRAPEGTRTWRATIGQDGKLFALEQILTVENFDKIASGMTREQVHELLGKPTRVQKFALSNEEHWDWRYADAATGGAAPNKMFIVVFGTEEKVIKTGHGDDPRDIKN